LKKKRALAAVDAAGHTLDPDEARGVVRDLSLEELDDALAGHVTDELFLDVDPRERRPIAGLAVRLRFIGPDLDLALRTWPVSSGIAFIVCPP
jgi:hypothetical protein